MAEYRTGDDGVLVLQSIDEFEHVINGIKTETVHARVEFDMYRPTGDTLLARGLDKGIKQTEGVDFGLEVVVEHGLEGRHLGIHDHDIGSDTGFTESDSLIGHGHSEIVHTVVLKRLRNLHGTCSVGVGLDHADHLCLGFQE